MTDSTNVHVKKRLGFILERPNLALAASVLHPGFGHTKFVSQQVRDDLLREIARWVLQFPRGRHGGERMIGAVEIPGAGPLDEDTVFRGLREIQAKFECAAPEDPIETIGRFTADDVPFVYWHHIANHHARGSIAHVAEIVLCIGVDF